MTSLRERETDLSSEFDFRIKQSVYVQALDTYKRAEEKLAEEREEQKSNMSYMRNNISGSSSDALEIATSSFFSPYGAYDRAWAQVKCVREMLEDTLPEINALMARCEEFPEQLQSDNYIEPIRPAAGNNTSRNGDILSLNYDKVAVIKDSCDQIAELGQEIGEELESIMQSCSGPLGGVNHDMEEARAATKEVKRVLNFKDSFQKYESGIKALEFDMLIGFSKLGILEGGLNTEETIGVTGIEIEDINSILEKPQNQWTDVEVQMIADVYIMAIDRNDTEVLEMIFEGLSIETYTEPEKHIVNAQGYGTYVSYHGTYEAKMDAEKCNRILEYINPLENGDAYFTITRLMNTSYKQEIGSTSLENYEHYETSIKVCVNDANELSVGLVTNNIHSGYERVMKELKFVVSDLYKEAGEDAIANMTELHFSTEEIVGILSQICTDGDKTFAYEMMGAGTEEEYKNLFATNPDILSVTGQNMLATYAYGLFDKSFMLDEAGIISTSKEYNFEQLETFLNGVLFKEAMWETKIYESSIPGVAPTTTTLYHTNYTDEYLAILSVCLEEYLTANSTIIYNNYEAIPEGAVTEQYKFKNMHALILSLQQLEINYNKSMDVKKITDLFGDHGYRIENLELDTEVTTSKTGMNIKDTMFSYMATLNYGMAENVENKVILSAESPQQAEELEEVEAYNAAVKNVRKTEINSVVNAAVTTISIFCPYVELGYNGLKMVKDANEAFSVADNINSVTIDDDNLSNSIKVTESAFGIYKDVMEAYEAKDKAYGEILDDWYESGTYVKISNQENALVGKGLYDPDVIIKKAMLYNEGFSFLCADEESVERGNKEIDNSVNADVLETMQSETTRSKEEKICVMKILWNGPGNEEERRILLELTDDQFQEYVGTISDLLRDVEINYSCSGTGGLEEKFKYYEVKAE